MRRIYGPSSMVIECTTDKLRLLGHNVPQVDEMARKVL